MALRPVVVCPQCKKAMRAHCKDWSCGWAFCAPCGMTMDPKNSRAIGKGE